MIKFLTAKHSLIRRLVVPLLAMLIVEGIIFYAFINLGGTRAYIWENSYSDFEEQLGYQSVDFQKNMVLNWGNLESTAQKIQNTINTTAEENSLALDNLQGSHEAYHVIISNVSENILDIIRKNSVTGAYIIFDSENKDELRALYYRDLDPISNPPDYSDILVEVGCGDVVKNFRLILDSQWDTNLKINELENTDFYYKPFNAAMDEKLLEKADKITDLGYWSKPFRYNDLDVITYSVPLINSETNKPYGVLGIELSLNYIRDYLHYENLGFNKTGSYAVSNFVHNDTYNVLFSTGPSLKKFLQENKTLRLNKIAEKNKIYEIKTNEGNDEKILGAINELKLYGAESPFYNERWYLVSLMRQDNLLSFGKTLSKSLDLALAVSLIIGFIGTMFISIHFTYPIMQFVNKVKQSSIEKPVKFQKTNVLEIDQLSESIESLNQNILDNSAKLSQILALSNLSIGAFEYDPATEKVFCTDVMFKFLNINKNESNTGYIGMDLFSSKLSIIIDKLTPNINNVFELKYNNRISWIKVKTMDNNGKILGIVMDVTNETSEKIKIEHQRDHDSMTHLYNRGAFLAILEERLRKSTNNKIGALIMCDLDNLKKTNDTYGHAYGDKYIRAAADALTFFNQYNGIVARMSGDEFLVFIDGFETKDDCRKVISKFNVLFKTAYIHIDSDTVVPLKASFGVSWYPEDSDDYNQLIKYADFAMYEVKNKYKNDIKEFELTAYKKSAELLKSKSEFNQLIKNNLFEYAFQPIVCAKTGDIYAYESLMRPKTATLKSPSDVMELATLQGRLKEIEKLTWFNTLNIYAKNIDKFDNAKIFINSIPNQLLEQVDLEYIDEVYRKIMPNVVIEIIESEKCDIKIIDSKKERIQSLGGLIALDDFGSGYSNSNVLISMAPDLVKMDMDLIHDIDVDTNKQALVQNMIAYAQERDIKIVAEGIQTAAELETVIRFGVDFIQGYFICKPSSDIPKVDKEIIDLIKAFNKEVEEKL